MNDNKWRYYCHRCDSRFDRLNSDADGWGICPGCGSDSYNKLEYCEDCGIELFGEEYYEGTRVEGVWMCVDCLTNYKKGDES